ncbi:MAG: type II secretion system F family protein [Candidatus Omnitrophica bacterium]|nr:type II secretion system F family protein [Candidatus Omnitrophota bacterium]
MMLLLIFILLAVSSMLIWQGLYASRSFEARDIKLPASSKAAFARKIDLHKMFSFLSPLMQKIMDRLKVVEAIKMRLDASHVRMTPPEFFAIKMILMIVFGIIGAFAAGKFELLYVVIGLAIGYILPELYLNQQIKKRKYAIARLLPETVDLLSLCVEAGLDFATSVGWIINKVPTNPLLEEFSFVLEEIKWGKPRTQALKDMAKRLNIPEISSFVQTLVQAERMGTPVAEAFAILSEDTRMQRFHRGERIALQAPMKILIPLIFCILPVIGIIIGGPIFLQFMGGNLLKGMGG